MNTYSTSLTVMAIALTLCVTAQPVLKPSIGLSSLPADNDPICTIPTYTGGFSVTGLQPGDTAADFTFYDLGGNAVNLETALSSGKPVLIVSSSYTCPVFRGKVPVINSVVATYSGQVSVVVMYCVEAHPDIDISPYFGTVNTTQANINAGILYRQPTTYGERKAIVSDMLDSMTIDAPVLLDGPCNEWWLHYGPAPNNAYLIDTTGIVFSKHAWFDRFPDDIICDIDSLLGNPTNCGTQANGTFQLVLTSDTVSYGSPGATFYSTADIINNSGADVLVQVKRLQNNIPAGWNTSMCLDACLPSNVDTTTVLIPAGNTQPYVMYFFSGATVDTGSTRMIFRNKNMPSNQYVQEFVGITDMTFGLHEVNRAIITVFPNPASDRLLISSEQEGRFELYDVSGRLLLITALAHGKTSLEVGHLPKGPSVWRVVGEGVTSGIVVLD